MNRAILSDAEHYLVQAVIDNDLWTAHQSLGAAERGARKAKGGQQIVAAAKRMRRVLPPKPTKIGTPIPPEVRTKLRAELSRYRDAVERARLRRALRDSR